MKSRENPLSRTFLTMIFLSLPVNAQSAQPNCELVAPNPYDTEAIPLTDDCPDDTRLSAADQELLTALRDRKDAGTIRKLLFQGANPRVVDQDGVPAILIAAQHGDRTTLRRLQDAGANLRATDPQGRTALHYAVMGNNGTVLSHLIDAAVPLTSRDQAGVTPIMAAARSGGVHLIRWLLRPADFTDNDHQGRGLLYHAVLSGSEEMVDLLMAEGTKHNARKPDLQILLEAAIHGKNIDLCRRFVAEGADPALPDATGQLPFFIAVDAGNPECAGMLLPENEERVTDPTGRTVLMGVATLPTLSDVLPDLNIKGRIDQMDQRRRSALFYAVTADNRNAVQWLLAHQANPNRTDHQRNTPLLLAVSRNQLEIVQDLLRANASVRPRTRSGHSALMLATLKGNASIAGELLARGASIQTVAPDGTTLLMAAALTGMTDFVTLLLQWGQNPRARNYKGESAIDLARRGNHHALVKLLEGR